MKNGLDIADALAGLFQDAGCESESEPPLSCRCYVTEDVRDAVRDLVRTIDQNAIDIADAVFILDHLDELRDKMRRKLSRSIR